MSKTIFKISAIKTEPRTPKRGVITSDYISHKAPDSVGNEALNNDEPNVTENYV